MILEILSGVKSKKELFKLKGSVDSFLSLVDTSIKKYEINVIVNIPGDIQVNTLRNELNQCLINLFNNSKRQAVGKEYKKICGDRCPNRKRVSFPFFYG